MKIMVISDLHYEHEIRKDADEGKAWNWLIEIVDLHKPDLLLSCGDWGSTINPEEFYELLRKTIVVSIYGNHENLQVLSSLYNVRTTYYLPVLLEDGKIYNINGIIVTGINGIIASKRTVRKGVPRKTVEDFIGIAEKLKNTDIDILLLHEAPALDIYRNKIAFDKRTKTVLEVIKLIKPKLVFNGHLHFSPYTVYRFEFGTLYIRIDSSQTSRHYCIYYPKRDIIEIWRDKELVRIISV